MELALEILCRMLASEQRRLSSHVPSASMPSTTRQVQRMPLLLIISTTSPGLYSVNGPATVVRLFAFTSHAQTFNRIGHVFQNACQVIHSIRHRVQIIRPAQMMEHLTLFFRSITRDASFELCGSLLQA